MGELGVVAMNRFVSLGLFLLLLIVILGFITAAWNRDRIAAWMFVPYAAWVAFASLLNGTLFAMN